MNDLKLKFTEFLKKVTNVKVVVFLGLAGMGLIFISSIMGGDKESDKESKIDNVIKSSSISSSSSEYSVQMEEKLKELLETIDGVGRTEIMVTVSESEEYVYAEEKTNSSESSIQKENQYVIVENSGERQPVLKKTVSPQISGVVIVCEGGDRSIVCENIYKTVLVAFNIPSSKIYVTKLK